MRRREESIGDSFCSSVCYSKLPMSRFFLVLTFFFFACISSAQEEKPHPIDAKIAAAQEKAGSTVEMRQVYSDGLKLWDAELNRVYAELKKKLKKEAFEALQNSQKQWLAHRDAEVRFLGEFYAQFQGTMYQPMHAAAVMKVTRARALDLIHRLELQNEHAGE
jgi:uncharacterized protein YecT (DUF1311 family)